MGQTMTEKILSRAAGEATVRKGDVVLANVEVLCMPDAERFIDLIEKHKLTLWDPKKVVFSFDHFFADSMPLGAAKEHAKIRRFAKEQGVPAENIYDVGRNGISHQVPVEEGWTLPGTVCVGSDTQSATMGAVNCFAIPALAGTSSVALTGQLWQVVPEAIEVRLRGALPKWVTGKDFVYRLIADLGNVVCGRVIEFSGPGIESLSIDARMAIANGAVQIGALTIVFPHDRILADYMNSRSHRPYEPVAPDDDANYVASYEYDLATIECLISGPHDIERVRPLHEVSGLEISAANIGSCSSGRLSDLALAAEVLRGHKIASGVRLVITPISATVMRQALEKGYLQAFLDAGATVTDPGCGACYQGNKSPLKLADGERCLSSSVENLSGRMGSTSAEIYLGNSAVVAASALEGRITDPLLYIGAPKEGTA
jgi:homoaconitase/3-isopropylmalate dehydratase large subunit